MKTKLEAYKLYLINIHRALTYYNFLRPFFNYLEKENIDFMTMTKDQLANYFTIRKFSANSINNLIKAGKDFCRYLGLKEHICFEMKQLDVEKKLRNYLTEDDIKKAIKYIATYNGRLDVNKIECVLYFILFTTVRKSEILNLKREKFNFENNTVKIYEKKLKQEKNIPFPVKFSEQLQLYFKSEDENTNAFNITKSQVDYLFRIVIAKYLGKKVSPHMLRHGSAKYLLGQGIPITCLQKIMGHSNITTTLIYAEADEKEIERNYREKVG
jgi:integrase/recombinase XerD